MAGSKSSYAQIFKSTSLFGGVQVLQIVLSIIRSKLVAVLLGPAGMGVNGLLSSTSSLIESLTNLGIATSAVRDVAEGSEQADKTKLSKTIFIVQRLAWVAALLGAVVTAVMSRSLSEFAFGNDKYQYSFLLLSFSILLNQLTAGRASVIRGMRFLRWMATASFLGSLLGLVASIPMYYLYGEQGIVPAIIISSVLSFVVTTYYYNKVGVKPTTVPASAVWADGKRMLILGFLLSMSSLITMGASYLLRIFINKSGSLDDVGLYNAGFAIINSYVGMVFTAMGMDYFPRLSSVADSRTELNNAVNEQAEVALLILSPILCIFIFLIKWVVLLFYSEAFLPINVMMQWAAVGMLFKAASWAIGFIILAKGDSRVFFWSELVANIYMVCLNMLGYRLAGLDGLGVAFLAGYLIYLLQVYFICRHFYRFSMTDGFMRFFFIQIVLCGGCFGVSIFQTGIFKYIFSIILVSGSVALSVYFLNKRLNIRAMLHKVISMIKGRNQ